MSGKLLVISVGPVQDFIAAARRTRDLWFGSYVLSEISKAVAYSLNKNGAKLIFPAIKDDDKNLLTPNSSHNVGNKLLAEVPEGIEPGSLVKEAKEEAQKRWEEFAQEALGVVRGAVKADIWEGQIKDVLEIYAAWTPLTSNYSQCWNRVEAILGGRKALRDFKKANGRSGIPKSSLDGARESVISGAVLSEDFKQRLKLKNNEQLDAIGLIKRLAGGSKNYPSVTRVAADPWIRGVASETAGKDKLEEISKLFEDKIAKLDDDNRKQYDEFLHDSSILYQSRHESLKKDGVDEQLIEKAKDIVKKLTEQYGEPSSYLAVLIADGDRMGSVISSLDSAEAHRTFSGRLSGFATKAQEIVKEQQGALVYSGGDDVMAFLPVDKCLTAAEELHGEFGRLLADFISEDGKTPTLSVGIAIGHCLEPLQDLLNMAREAERDAKEPDRNGLAVHLHTRSGGDTVKVRALWSSNFPKQLNETWSDYFAKQAVSEKAAYDLRELARDYQGWGDSLPADKFEKLLQDDVKRILNKKRPNKKKIEDSVFEELLQEIKSLNDLKRLSNGLILASRIAECRAEATGKAKRRRENADSENPIT